MIIAIIDLGTNTFNLLIVEVFDDNSYKQISKTKLEVKLGEGGINRNFITPLAFERGMNALREHKRSIEKYKAEKIIAFATSAIRSSSNGAEFIRKVKRDIDLEVKILSGEQEAEFIYYGVRQALDLRSEATLIMDIGGGSNEFIIANNSEIFWKQSLDLGAARLLEKFNPSDPITLEELKRIEDHLRLTLFPLFYALEKYPVKELIGSSGSFETFAEMIAYKKYTPEILKGKTEYIFDINDFHDIYQQIIKSTTKERLHTKGLIKMRVDMIVISGIFVNFILSSFNIKKMRLSTYALKEGVLWKLLER